MPRVLPPVSNRVSRNIAAGGAVVMVVALLASCGRSGKEEPDESTDPVALEIGGRSILQSELQAEIDLLRERRSPSAASLEAFLEPNIERLVALEQARAIGLDQDVALRRQWENMLIGRLREVEIESRIRDIEVTETEIDARYAEDAEIYTRPAQVRLGLLFLAASQRATEEARAEIHARLEEARSLAADLPADTRGFGALAMNYSEEATSRFRGGDVGWIQAGEELYRWPDEVMTAAFNLENEGDISQVIEAEDGFYLVKLLDARAPVVRPLDASLRASISAAILREKRTAIEEGLATTWRDSHPVVEHRSALDALRFDAPAADADTDSSIPTNP